MLTDPAVGAALVPAINRKELVDNVLGPEFKPATSTLASATPGYAPLDDVTYDPDKAEKILDEAGWIPGTDGIRVKDGHRLSFPVLFSPVFGQTPHSRTHQHPAATPQARFTRAGPHPPTTEQLLSRRIRRTSVKTRGYSPPGKRSATIMA